MKNKILLFIMMLTVSMSAFAKGKDDMPQYDITGAGSGSSGTMLVKVYIYEKKATDQQFKVAAIHGVVFRGYQGNSSGTRQPAMTNTKSEKDYAEFCKEFFSTEGDCQNYATIIPGTYDRIKTPKGYKVGAMLQIDKVSLRKTLQEVGLVRSLSSGF